MVKKYLNKSKLPNLYTCKVAILGLGYVGLPLAIAIAKKNKVELMTFQSNAEHELVDRIQAGKEEKVSCILFNPGAFTHTSVALRDAILGVDIPLIEIHISNIFNREAFREKSYFSDIAVGIISGFGEQGYKAALELAIERF